MDEGAQRKAEASLKAANQQIQAGKGFKYGKLASPQARQQYVENNKTPTFNLASATAKSFFTKAVPTVGAGAARSAVGGLEGLSGTYDLFTPGKGTSRVTKGLVGAGGAVDRFVDRNNLDKTGYKISQATGDLAQFLAPSAVAQGLSKAGKFSKAAKFASSTAPLINKGGRFARYASTPANVLNTAIATGKQQGYLTARDKDVNAKTVGASVAGNLALGAGLNMAGSKIVDKLARRKGVKPVATPKQDVTLKSRELTPEQIQARETRKTQDMMWDNLSPAARKSQEAARKKSLWKDEGGAVLGPQNSPVLKKLGITSSKGMDASTERQMVKDYFEGKPTVKGSALTGEGAQVPTRGLSSEAKAKLIANARKQTLRRNQEGSILSPQESPIVKKIQEAFTPKPLNTETNITSVREKYSPDRFIRENVTRPAVNKVKQAVYKASVSENPLARGAAKTVMGVNREIGTPEELLAARRKMFGTSEMGKLEGKNTADLTKDVQSESQRRIWATLDPAQASKMGVTATEADLTPDELKLQQNLKKTIDETTQGNLERGLITPEQAANESYIRRAYEPFETAEDPKVYQEVKSGLLKQFKGRKEVDQSLIEQAITDPAYLVGRKQALSAQAWAHVDYANHLADNGYVFDSARKGLVQLPTNKLYGRAAGKWVAPDVMKDFEGFKYQNSMVNAFNDLVTAYDRLGLRRLKKEMLTVFNPAVRLGNQLSNRVAFSTLNGHNPVEFNIAMQKTKGMIKSQDPLYKEAVQQGLIGTDIVQGDFTQNLAKYVDDPNILKQSKDWVRKSYSEADDRARLASYILHRKQGYSPSDAATLTQRGFQDYKSVGWMFDMAAKTPVIGNAFVRFSSDATRILSNALIDHPLRTISTVALYGAMNNAMSKISGESEEDKATREGRFGAPKIPFTNVSLETQTPWGAVNVARFMPFYQLNDVSSPIARFLPIQSNPLKPSGWNDPLLGQALQVATDQDFRGKSIQDPQNTTYDSKGNVKKFPELPADERRDNLLRFLGVQNAPLGREVDSILSAVKKTPDIYGKERSLPQAIARSMGVKVEQYGEEQAAKQRSTNEFFEGNIERVKQFNKENPDLEQAYYTFNNPTRDRKTGKKTSNLVSPERWKVVSADASGRLYNFLRSEAELANQKDGKPIDPVYQLPTPEQQKQVLELRSRPTGDDIETEEILRATQPWYKAFEKAERDYYSANSKYYSGKGLPDSQNARVKEYAAVKYPEQSPLVQKYYQVKASDPTAGKEFFKANADALSTAFQTYKDQRLRYINAKRKIEGFPPISANAFNNVTFGYEDDERKVYNELKYGKGYGSYGSGGSARVNAAKYLQDRPSVGTTKVKVSAKAPQIAVKARNTGASKPKVSIKKSRV